MQTKDILALEGTNEGDILLLREGLFWRAYQLSAFLFSTHIRPLKVTSRHVKVVKANLAYVGFPDKILEGIVQAAGEKGWNIERQEKQIRIIVGLPVDRAAYQQWFEAQAPSEEESAATFPYLGQDKILEKIRSYPIMEKTPLETQRFVLELQKEINGHL
ncbi:MAG: hypothetical protein H6559_00055 [Lewinellaceae bacterium]|nr:hypothetical protein [Lewinellaceae bacterium]